MNQPEPSSLPNSDANHGRFACLILCLAAGLGLAAILNVEPLLSANDRSRWATVWSLAVRDTYQIDEIIQRDGWDTIDKVRHEDHFYSTKPPLFPTMVAWVYRGVKAVTGWRLVGDVDDLDLDPKDRPPDDTRAVTRAILILVNLLPMLVAIGLLAWFLPRYTHSKATLWTLVVIAAFGTFLSSYIVTLNNHTVAAVSIVFSLIPTARIVCDEERHPLLFLTAGFFAAFACTNELPAALWGVIVFGLLVWKSPRLTALYFVPAALVPLAGFFWTNYRATGGIKPFYAYYGTEKYEYVFEGIPSYWMNPKGIDANREPPWLYFLHCTIGHHGILSLTPIFLLTLWSWLDVRSWTSHRLRIIHAVGIALTVAVIGFYLSRTENYNYGGNTAGLRWVFWLIPFWLLALLPLFDRFGERRWFSGLTGVLLIGSVCTMASACANPWQPSWLYGVMKKWEWIDYDTPPPELPRKLTTWFSTLPKWDEESPAWIEFSTPEADGSITTLRLLDGGRPWEDRPIRKLFVIWNIKGREEKLETYYLDEDKFAEGRYPKEFLLWDNETTDAAARQAGYAFFQNLPHPKPYNNDHLRYLKTPLRSDEAFRCQQAAAQVDHVSPSRGRLNYRSDVWICDQVPFGVLRFQTTIRDRSSGEVVEYRRFDVSNASWYFETSPSQ